MATLFDARRDLTIADGYDELADAVLYPGDCADLLRSIPDGAVDLVITSPPYNIGKAYEKATTLQAYLDGQAPVIAELKRVLADTGSVCWQVGNFVADGEVFPLDVFYYNIFKGLGMKLRNRIIWRFNHGLHASKRFSGRYETILWFTKGDRYTFNLDRVRVPAKYPGKLHFKGPKRGQPSGNPLGKNPSDVWDIVLQEWEAEVWDIPNVKSNHPEKTDHPCQFPIELVERCVLALTDEGDAVLDPYGGVGSAVIAAVKNGRKGIAADRDESYVAIARDRLERFARGALPIRPLGKPIHAPSGREKVSQRPVIWDADAEGSDR